MNNQACQCASGDLPALKENQVFLEIQGMSCAGCVRHVTQAIQSVPGIAEVKVDLDQGLARIGWTSGVAPRLESVVRAVEHAGFEARIPRRNDTAGSKTKGWLSGWRLNVILGFIALVPLGLGEWIFHWHARTWFHWTGFCLALLVQVVAGARFYRGAWIQLRHGSSNMDTLVALGSSTAFGYSSWLLFTHQTSHLYFLESVSIITLISAGHWLETLTTEKAAHAIRLLFQLAPATARKRMPDGSELEVPVMEIRPGDLVVLGPGDRIPVDGEITEGISAVNESMITGESVPKNKTVGGALYTGSLNLNGRLVFRVTATGQSTALAHIVAAVEKCQDSRAEIQRLGDRVSGIFVPAVILVALLTAIGWSVFPEQARASNAHLQLWLWPIQLPAQGLAVLCAASVLIVACPCAMGLATPAALMVAARVAARCGILVRDGIALEKSGRITTVVFDKTGTLTNGKLEVVEVLCPSKQSAGTSLARAVAASLARPSKHPISQALANVSQTAVGLSQWQELQGFGITARLSEALDWLPASTQVFQGSIAWLAENGVDLRTHEIQIQEWWRQGSTVVGLAAHQTLLALFALRDELKPHAVEVLAELHRQGKQVALISGDARLAVQAVAQKLKIDPSLVFAEIRPEEKSALVHELQRKGERVAFVGDGINDAPALEQADLGVAVSQASDLARESADLILLNSDIQAFPEALRLAQATLRTIKQNLFWAFFYNAAAIPLAALGFLSPIVCALAMGLSDLVVIGNSIRLRWRRP